MSGGTIRAICAAMGHHPLIGELFETLPPVGETWLPAKREKWLTAAKGIFDLIYADSPAAKKPQDGALLNLLPAAERKHFGYGSEFVSEPQRHVIDALRQEEKREDGWIAVPVRAIAMKAGVSANGINSVLDALERKGLIKIDRRKGDGVNRYFIEERPMQ